MSNKKEPVDSKTLAPSDEARSRGIWINRYGLGLLAITLAGAWLRLVDLGLSALRADTILFWNICGRESGAGAIWRKWMDFGPGGQFPFPMAVTEFFLHTFGIPLTHFTVRFPSAVWGILTIPVCYAMGKALGNKRVGLLAAALLAFNPYLIQVSREAYFYPPMVFGAFLCFWGLILAYDPALDRTRIPWKMILVNALGLFFLTYSQPTGWPLGGVCVLAVMAREAWLLYKTRAWRPGLFLLVVAYLLVGLPLLIEPWALPQMRSVASDAARETALKALAVQETGVLDMIWMVCTSFSWGGTWLRATFSIGALILGVACAIKMRKTDKRYLMLPVMILALFLLYQISRAMAGAMYEPRYMLSSIPAYLFLLALGVTYAGDFEFKRAPASPKLRKTLKVGLPLIAVALLAHPALVSTQLTGKPTPYKDIVAWVDANLPNGAPVLVDRWLEPWNELAVYPSTNAFFTFTVPNEPLEAYLQNNWRQSARQFLERFPDAAYIEMVKEYQEVETVGPWTWPAQYFSRYVAITNEAGLKLRELGVANRGDFYAANSNRVVVEIFYNTTEDLLKKARADQKPYLLLFGPGWSFMKPWQQTGQFTEYRVMEANAPFELYNLLDYPYQAMLVLQAVAINGTKRVQTQDGMTYDFPSGQLVVKELGPFVLQPGKNLIRLHDNLWPAAQSPLLVSNAAIKPVRE
ncbi:MAG: hypothetical protein EOM20_18985 [Spartobacteria bacterium]|nr:hypothetical protein [Spartobacteria bacterium]